MRRNSGFRRIEARRRCPLPAPQGPFQTKPPSAPAHTLRAGAGPAARAPSDRPCTGIPAALGASAPPCADPPPTPAAPRPQAARAPASARSCRRRRSPALTTTTAPTCTAPMMSSRSASWALSPTPPTAARSSAARPSAACARWGAGLGARPSPAAHLRGGPTPYLPLQSPHPGACARPPTLAQPAGAIPDPPAPPPGLVLLLEPRQLRHHGARAPLADAAPRRQVHLQPQVCLRRQA
jgi:hypothetical protein